MKQVWQCDHCIETHVNVADMEQHEATCSFDPVHKTCYSCDHHFYEWDMQACSAGCSYGHMIDVIDGDEKCLKWEKEK